MRRTVSRSALIITLVSALALLLTAACAEAAPAVSQAPQQPAAAAQPAPAAPAPDPERPAAISLAEYTSGGSVSSETAAGAGESDVKYGGIPVMAIRRDPPAGWDRMKTNVFYDLHAMGAPIWGNGNMVRMCLDNIYDVCPGLAQSWQPNSDFSEWTFTVRDNVLWHDGSPFTAEDAAFWFGLVIHGAESGGQTRTSAIYAGNYAGAEVELVDSTRVRLTLPEGNPQFLHGIKLPDHVVALPKHLAQPFIDRGEVNVSPLEIGLVGTGPFILEKYVKGSRATVRRFDKYWDVDDQDRQLPYLDGVDFAIIYDPAAMDAAFRVGRLEGGARASGHSLTPDRENAYSRDMGDDVYFYRAGSGRSGIPLNSLKPGPLQDVRVRKAISLWMDRQAAVRALDSFSPGTLLGDGNPFASPDLLDWPGWNPATKLLDRQEARRLMAEAGFRDGAQMDIVCDSSRGNQVRRCEFYKDQLQDLGIDLQLSLVDRAQYSSALTSIDHDLYHHTTTHLIVPEAALQYLSRYSEAPFSLGKHEDPKIGALFGKLFAARSDGERTTAWRELERYYLLEQAYYVPMTNSVTSVPYRSYVMGIRETPEITMHGLDLAVVWLDK